MSENTRTAFIKLHEESACWRLIGAQSRQKQQSANVR